MKSKALEPADGYLLLIRHGIAEDPRPGLKDAERPLTDEGWRKTRAAMAGLVQAGRVPDLAFSSPYRRAAETLTCLEEALLKRGRKSVPAKSWEGCVPESDPAKAETWLLKQLNAAQRGCVLAVVSHQPFLGELVYRLTGMNLEIKKASCTVVAWRGGCWAFERHFAPSELRGME